VSDDVRFTLWFRVNVQISISASRLLVWLVFYTPCTVPVFCVVRSCGETLKDHQPFVASYIIYIPFVNKQRRDDVNTRSKYLFETEIFCSYVKLHLMTRDYI